jgi:hypothetical protein
LRRIQSAGPDQPRWLGWCYLSDRVVLRQTKSPAKFFSEQRSVRAFDFLQVLGSRKISVLMLDLQAGPCRQIVEKV